MGKTRLGVLAATKAVEKNLSVLIIVPRANLRDNEWKAEFFKWSSKDVYLKCRIECIQTVYKWHKQHFDLVIVDEAHTTLSEQYRKFYFNNSYRSLLCLTATVPENDEYKTFLLSIAPIVYSINIQQSQAKDLVSDYQIYNLALPLTPNEKIKYGWAQKEFKKALISISTIMEMNERERFPSVMDFANAKLKDRASPYYRLALDFYRYMGSRKTICYNAENKLDICLKIIQQYPERK